MIIKNFLRLFKTNVFQTIITIFLLSFFLFLQNILVSLTFSMKFLSDDLKNKLWVYLYFKEWNSKDEIIKNNDLIIDLMTRLQKAKLEVQYLPKDKWLKTLSKRLPKIIENFEKYWIKNPIPATMYIIFKNGKEYEKMKNIVTDKKYQNIILNISDIWTKNSFKKQEDRVRKIISFSNFLIKFYIGISIALFVSILWFLVVIIKINFYSFYAQIEVEKLIWFPYFKIILPFLIYVVFLIIFAFLLSLWYSYILVYNYLWPYLLSTFDYNLISFIEQNIKIIFVYLWKEFTITTALSLLVSYFFMVRLIKKI